MRAIECIHLGEAVGDWSKTPTEFEIFVLTGTGSEQEERRHVCTLTARGHGVVA